MDRPLPSHKYPRRLRRRIWVAFFSAIAVALLLPWIFKDRTPKSLRGPRLSDLEYAEVFFDNRDLHLAGMLFKPVGPGPFPTAVMIHGSGASRRDSPWYLTVADHLRQNGIAVLLPDKRGSEKSGGDWRGASFDDLAADTLAAIAHLKAQQHFDCSYLGIVGMSQGGWIAPVAAAKSTDVSYVVSMSGAAVTTDEQLWHEEVNNIAELGTYRFIARLIAPFTTARIKRKPFWRGIAGFDPIPFWKKVTVPKFFAYGQGDANVPVEKSIKRLKELEQSPTIKVYPRGGHGITDPKTRRVQAAFLNDLVQFISRPHNTSNR